ncbi:hypothetical protein [Aestuariibaculum lutulentum]|uniref:DUF4163 domain-containing protein n=1 Tax=Aestuariibaculum lutulentum TaxID=2920935 RepID=A0ABS9RFL1_9FLAO|nr:hypothetical protein [Aestuariibaculum lutulentum]MCH4551729.1 hypothetical protein [Aestuariibaculum lutulentum]
MKYLFYFLFLFCLSNIYAQSDSFKIECFEKMEENDNSLDSVIVRICKFRNHLFKSIGEPDYKGRYSYQYELFRIDKKDTLRVNNLSFFNENSLELEQLLNDKLKTEFQADSEIFELKSCLEQINFRYFKLNEFGISFLDDNHMQFIINYGVGGACFNMNLGMVIMSIREVEKYIK